MHNRKRNPIDNAISPGDFRFSLLENGLDFALSSLEHLTDASGGKRTEQKRHLKYALLHLCSAVELIFKERLRQEHWTLVFKDVNKADKKSYERGDFNSVTFDEAQDRLIGTCGITLTEDQRRQLRHFRGRRNQLEHFGAVDTLPAVTATVSSMISFLLDFIGSALAEDALDAERDMLRKIRSGLGECEAFVEQRWKEIAKDVEASSTVVECPTCGQDAFIVYDCTVKCRFCNHSSDPEDAADEYIGTVLGLSRYSVMKDGDVWPIYECPECEVQALVEQTPDEDGSRNYICFNCGEISAYGQLEHCSCCGEVYQPSEPEDPGVCAECWQHKVGKD